MKSGTNLDQRQIDHRRFWEKKKAVRLKCRSITKAHAVVLPACTFHSSECWSTTAQQAMTRKESNWLM